MNQTERLSLEALAGRPLTEQEAQDIEGFLPSRNDVGIAAVLSVGRFVTSAISKAQFQMWCGKTHMRAAIEDHALNTASPLRSIALTLRDFLIGPVGTIDFNEQANVTMLGAWQYAQAITQEEADELVSLGRAPDPIHYTQVSDALNKAQGLMTL